MHTAVQHQGLAPVTLLQLLPQPTPCWKDDAVHYQCLSPIEREPATPLLPCSKHSTVHYQCLSPIERGPPTPLLPCCEHDTVHYQCPIANEMELPAPTIPLPCWENDTVHYQSLAPMEREPSTPPSLCSMAKRYDSSCEPASLHRAIAAAVAEGVARGQQEQRLRKAWEGAWTVWEARPCEAAPSWAKTAPPHAVGGGAAVAVAAAAAAAGMNARHHEGLEAWELPQQAWEAAPSCQDGTTQPPMSADGFTDRPVCTIHRVTPSGFGPADGPHAGCARSPSAQTLLPLLLVLPPPTFPVAVVPEAASCVFAEGVREGFRRAFGNEQLCRAVGRQAAH